MVTLRRALETIDTEPELGKVRAKVLYVLSRIDKLFPPSIAPDGMDKLAKAGVDAPRTWRSTASSATVPAARSGRSGDRR